MKKILCLILIFAICLPIFVGCDSENENEKFCRVLSIEKDGFVVDWDTNFIYVKYNDTDMGIDELDTVVIDFLEADLKPQTGKFVDAFGKECDYVYILEDFNSIRFPTAEEPTFA